MSTALGYFTIDTPDIDRARAFFGEVFGWTFDEASSHETYAHVADAGVPFGFVKGEHRDFSHLYFQVDDIDSACARITARGGKSAVPAAGKSGRSVKVSDDQGVSFSLWQPAGTP
ncbi:MAG: VOC family protein [Brevundimonas sp.]